MCNQLTILSLLQNSMYSPTPKSEVDYMPDSMLHTLARFILLNLHSRPRKLECYPFDKREHWDTEWFRLQLPLGGARILQSASPEAVRVSPSSIFPDLACSMILASVSSCLFLHISSNQWTTTAQGLDGALSCWWNLSSRGPIQSQAAFEDLQLPPRGRQQASSIV